MNRSEQPWVNGWEIPVADGQLDTSGNKCYRATQLFGCSRLILYLYVLFCLALAMVAYLRPLPTYDRLLYAGAVASLRYSDPVTLHRIARAEFDAQPSPFKFENVASRPYFVDVRDNPYHFVQQLGFYRVKLGYVAAGYALWRAGLPILVSLRLVSACCLFIVGLALLAWTHDAILSAVLLRVPPVSDMGRVVTADPLSMALVFLALFALAERRDLLATGLLVASILARPDNLVLALILLAWMAWKRRLRLSIGALFGTVAFITYALVGRIAGAFSHRLLLYHTFVRPEVDPITHPILISFSGYLQSLGALKVVPFTLMTVFTLVAAAAWIRLPKGSFFRDLLLVISFYIVVRLLLFPDFEERYFVVAYLIASVAFIQAAQFPISVLAKTVCTHHVAGSGHVLPATDH